MKKQMIFSLIFLMILMSAQAQKTYDNNDIRNVKTLYWFGVDLSKALLIEGFNHAYDVQQNYFLDWNTYLLSVDVNLKYLLKKDTLIPYLSIIEQRNKYYKKNINEIDADTIQSIIRQYSYPFDQGIGLVIIVDNFDKPNEKGYGWVTYFDLKSKNVLSTHLIMGKTKMGGMVTHWGEALKNIIYQGAIY